VVQSFFEPLADSWFDEIADHELIGLLPGGSTNDAHCRVESERVFIGDGPREWMKIQRGILREQSADSVV
jgi:hypothetical protein